MAVRLCVGRHLERRPNVCCVAQPCAPCGARRAVEGGVLARIPLCLHPGFSGGGEKVACRCCARFATKTRGGRSRRPNCGRVWNDEWQDIARRAAARTMTRDEAQNASGDRAVSMPPPSTVVEDKPRGNAARIPLCDAAGRARCGLATGTLPSSLSLKSCAAAVCSPL